MKIPNIVKSYVDWIKVNKEGAVIGLAVAIVAFLSRDQLPFVIDPIKGLFNIQSKDILFSTMISLGVVIGAIIDSLYKPRK